MLSVLVSCGGPEPINPTPVTPVTPAKDTKAPVITVAKSSVNVIAGPSVTVSGSELKIGDSQAASWKDDVSSACTLVLTFTPTGGSAKTISS